MNLIQKLSNVWFTYGNHGPKCTMANHNYVQRCYEEAQAGRKPYQRDLDQWRKFYKPTKQCVDAVAAALGPVPAGLNKGDRMVIYHDPFTQEKPEGMAKLVKLVTDLGDCEAWLVVFDGDTHRVYRKIKKP